MRVELGVFMVVVTMALGCSSDEGSPTEGGGGGSGGPVGTAGKAGTSSSPCASILGNHEPGTADCSVPPPDGTICAEFDGFGSRIYPITMFHRGSLEPHACVRWPDNTTDNLSLDIYHNGPSPTVVDPGVYDCENNYVGMTFATGVEARLWRASTRGGGVAMEGIGSCRYEVTLGGDVASERITGTFAGTLKLVQEGGFSPGYDDNRAISGSFALVP